MTNIFESAGMNRTKFTLKPLIALVSTPITTMMLSLLGLISLLAKQPIGSSIAFCMLGFMAGWAMWLTHRNREASQPPQLTPEQLLQLVIDSIPQRICWKDTDYTYLGCNTSFAQDAGFDHPQHIIGKTDYDLNWDIDTADQIRANDSHVITVDETQQHVVERRNTAQGIRWFDRNHVPVHDENGKIVSLLTTLEDITDRVDYDLKLQDAIRIAEDSAKAKADFLANMSHEIRTPMNGVLGMLSLALQTELSEEQRNYLETAHNSGDMLLTLLNDILDISKIEAGKMLLEDIDFNIHELVEETLSLMAENAHKKGLELVCLFARNVPQWANGDPTRLRQILSNLVSNAIKFTTQGHVVIRVKRDMSVEDHLALNFAVIDTGIGIPEEALDTIFELFSQADGSTTRNFGGTGLGLALCRKLSQAMGGDIAVESEPGEGSAFSFHVQINKSLDERPPLTFPERVSSQPITLYSSFRYDISRLKQLLAVSSSSVQTSSDPEALIASVSDQQTLCIVDRDSLSEEDFTALNQTMKAKHQQGILLLKHGAEFKADIDMWTPVHKPISSRAFYAALKDESGQKTQAHTSPKTIHQVFDEDIKILLVEDNPVNQKVALGVMKKLGLSAAVANNGEEAVSAYQATPYDIIFMDCQMPVMDGFEATQRIRELETKKNTRTPIIALTANAMSGDKERCLAAGMDDYLAKPFKPQNIKDAIERWIRFPVE